MSRPAKNSVQGLNQQIADAIRSQNAGGVPGAKPSSTADILKQDGKNAGPGGHQRGGGSGKHGQNKLGASAPRRTSG